MANHAPPSNDNPLQDVIYFGIHVVLGTLMFTLYAVPAAALNASVHWLEKREVVDWALVLLFKAAEYLLVGLDGVCFLGWFLRVARESIPRFWSWLWR